ncbi:Aste57867_25094 [Aphanomyces stellatus]|uniref:Aste57867_25094 protein n=1 Tax=Aphanomyces stellatus TaxID=120398 RepID=A0A485LSA2_9STRA|nr:hypothetical protein As57867_025016 [Aphanomyces stellatus]VFU01725.1 Aste57867_25094 [Aphanomyces stellatus]
MAPPGDTEDAAFETAVARISEAQTTHKHLLSRYTLQLYGLLQQAHHGDNDSDRPRCPVNLDGKAKWDAWTLRRGLTEAAAKAEYVRLVDSILPSPPLRSSSSSSTASRSTRHMRRYKPAEAVSLPRVVGQLLLSLLFLVLCISFAIWLSQQANNRCRKSTSTACVVWRESRGVRAAAGWLAVGLVLGALLQSNLLQWNILSVLYVETTPAMPTDDLPASSSAPSAELQLLTKLGLVLGKVGDATTEHPVMVFSPKDGSASLGSTRSVMEHPIAVATDMHFRRFREPLPDPMQPALAAIELIEEIPLPQWHCVFRKRKLKIKNNTPAFLRRFASDEFFYLIEDSLWDSANQVLYVRGRNESFAHLVLVEDFLLFQRHPDQVGWSQVTQSGACVIGGAFGFLRSTVEGFVRDSYTRSVKRAQDYLVDRLDDEAALASRSVA